MDVDGAPVVIDLGLERGEPGSYVEPGRSTYPGWVPAAFLAALVLVFAGASAAPARSPLSALITVRMTPADGYTLTDDGRLLAQSFGTLGSYDLRTGQSGWHSEQSVPSYRLRTADGLVLLRPFAIGAGEPGTTAVSDVTGEVRWRRADNVVMVAGSSALLAVRDVRTLIGTANRIEGSIEDVDPVTGITRWRVDLPNTGVVLGVPGPGDSGARMLVVRDDRAALLYDLDSGAELARTTLPGADYTPANPAVAGGVILLRHGGNDGMELSAYDPATLRMLWSEPAADAVLVRACGELACVSGTAGIRALDPATGDQAWARPGWSSVEEQGTSVIAYADQGETLPVGVIDPASGAVRVPLAGWQPVQGSGDPVFATRVVDEGSRTMVAVARPGDSAPRLVAELPAGSGECQSVPDRLVCRSALGELVVWAYRQEG